MVIVSKLLWKVTAFPLWRAIAIFSVILLSLFLSRSANLNFVNFSPVTPELTELICERLVRHGQKTGIFSRKSQDVLDRFSQSFHHMKALSVQMIDLCLIFRFVKGCCHGNQIMLGEMTK